MKPKKSIGIWATGGGPTGGRAILGMLKYLEEIGIYPDRIKVVGGTSMGAYILASTCNAWNIDRIIEIGFKQTDEVVGAPNLKTKVGFLDIEPGIRFIQREFFGGHNPKSNETTIPIVTAVANWNTLETRYLDGNIPILDALRLSIRNPVYFNLHQDGDGIIGDSGIVSSVGASYLRKKYRIKDVILFDIQSSHKWKSERVDKHLPILPKGIIKSSLLLTKTPILGKALKRQHFPAKISTLVHLPYMTNVLERAAVSLLTRIIDFEIEKQKPSVVIRLEDVLDIKPLGRSAWDRKVGMQQIEYGYKAAQLKNKELRRLLR